MDRAAANGCAAENTARDRFAGWSASSSCCRGRGGGTTLIHRLRLEPSSWKIRLGSRWGVGVSLRKSLDRVYRRIDATLESQRARALSPGVDPFEAARRRCRLRAASGWSACSTAWSNRASTSRLSTGWASIWPLGPPQEVARIRPLALARRWGLDPEQVATACLHGAREGLLELHWDLLCPVCRISCEVTDTLRAIAEHAHCEACHLDFQLDFANSIELIFRVHPEIRAADLGIYCIGGPAHSPHVLAQIRVAANERIELELELAGGLVPPARPAIALVGRLRGRKLGDDTPLGHRPRVSADRSRRRCASGGQVLIFEQSSSRRAGRARRADRDQGRCAHGGARHVDGTLSRAFPRRGPRTRPACDGLDGDPDGDRT